MPTYEYRCKHCGHQFDIQQSFTDDALTECHSCGEATLKKVFGNVGITFKGSGFYKTDSRSAGTFGSTRDADRTDVKKSIEKDSGSSTTTDGGSSSDGAKKADTSSSGTSSSSSSSSSGSGSSSTSSS